MSMLYTLKVLHVTLGNINIYHCQSHMNTLLSLGAAIIIAAPKEKGCWR